MENEIPSEKVKRATKSNLGTDIGRIIWLGRFRGQKRRGTRRRIRAQLFGGPVFKKEEACTWSEHFEQFLSDVSEMIASSYQPLPVRRRATYYRRSWRPGFPADFRNVPCNVLQRSSTFPALLRQVGPASSEIFHQEASNS